MPQVALRLWGLAPDFAQEPYAQGVSEDARLFTASLREPFCGVNSGFEVAQWLDQPGAAASVALLPLRRVAGQEDSSFGLLVLASPDAQRFASTLATDFLQRVADLSSAALARLL